ncbi:primase C-terminal domain-containing protein, partial [Staphylococcus aureus]
RRRNLKDQASMDKLERWVINNTGDGNRNNMLLRYAMILLDAGFSVNAIHGKVNELNSKMADKLSEIEIASTIMVSVAKKAGANGNLA